MTKKMGPKETERFFREGGKDALKNVYEGEPWEASPLIVKVANPGNYGRIHRFVVVWDNKSKDHKTCPFYHNMMNKETTEIDSGKPTQLELTQSKEGEEATAFVPWEEKEAKECDHDLVQELFLKRRMPKKEEPKEKKHQKNNKKMRKPAKTDKKFKKAKKRTKRFSNGAKEDFSCKEEISEKILKILKSSFKYKKSTCGGKKTTLTADKTTSQASRGRDGQATPRFLRRGTERLHQRKSVKTKRSLRRKREARSVVRKVMDSLLVKVLRRVDAEERQSETQDKVKMSSKLAENLLPGVLDKMMLLVGSPKAQPRTQSDDVVQRW